jgi:hypothetical protein
LFDKEKDMTFDPTTNRIPFGLLTQEEQATLKAWPYGWEFFHWDVKEWKPYDPSWFNGNVYRGKPAPKVTSYWFNIYEGGRIGHFWPSKGTAETLALDNTTIMRMQICNGEVTVTKET